MAVRHLALGLTTAPSSPVDNQLWYDEANDLLKRWDDATSAWVTAGTGTYVQGAWLPRTMPPWAFNTNITWPLANRFHWNRFEGPRSTDVTSLRIYVGTQSGNIALGIWSPSGSGTSATPGTKKVYTGSVACPASGVQDIALGATYTIQEGDFVGFGCDNATAAFAGFQGLGVAAANGWVGYTDRADLADPGDSPGVGVWDNFRNFFIAGIE